MANHASVCEIWGGSRSDSWLLEWEPSLGSGIKRALEAWPYIDFMADQDGCLFTVTVHRKSGEQLELVGDSLGKGSRITKKFTKKFTKN